MVYINDLGNIDVSQNETIGYSILGGYFNSFAAFTPEYYSFIDASRHGQLMVTFKAAIPYFHNFDTVTTYNTFFGSKTNMYVTLVCNGESPQTEKRWTTVMYDSKDRTSQTSGIKWSAATVTTSDNQTSTIPIDSFIFRENRYFSVFYRDTSLGDNLATGDQLRGTWIEVNFLRDTDPDIQDQYSEFARAIIEFYTSSYTR